MSAYGIADVSYQPSLDLYDVLSLNTYFSVWNMSGRDIRPIVYSDIKHIRISI